MKVPYKLVSLADVVLDTSKELAFDTETCGFYGRIRLAQFYQESDDFVQLVEWPDEFLLACLLNDYHSYMHNAHYDITTIQEQTETRWEPKKYDCTLLLSRLAFPAEDNYDAETLLAKVLGYDPYRAQHLDKKALQKSDWSKTVLTEDQFLYAATDVYYLPNLYNAVKVAKPTMSYKVDMLTLKHCLDFQWNGMPIDYDRIATHQVKNKKILDDIDMPVNVNSPKQVKEYLGIEGTTGDLVLAQMSHNGNDKAKNVRTCRKTIKQNSFLTKYSEMISLIGKFKPLARSGRLTANDENKQQIPRKLKDCFGYKPDEGRVLIYSDYAQIELRTIACITECSLMIQKFREGVDLHDFTAEMIFGQDFTPKQRQLTKTANFNFLYAGGVPIFIGILVKEADLWIEEREGYSLRNRWRNLWTEIYSWQQRGINAWKKGKLWATALGRQYKGNMMTDQLNIQNQGTAAEVFKLALHYMKPKLDAIDVKIVNVIHDAFVHDCPNDPAIYKEAAQITADAMQEAWTEMSKLFKVKDLPMPVNVRVGYNWGDIEHDKFIWELNQ